MHLSRVLAIFSLLTTALCLPHGAFQTRSQPDLVFSTPKNHITAGTYPRAMHLDNTTLLLAYTSNSDRATTLRVMVSTDTGATWSPRGSITTGVGDIDNPYLLRLPSGRILAAFRNHDRSINGTYTHFRITMCTSTDDGASWTWLSEPAAESNPITGLWEPFLRVSSVDPNIVQLFYSRENRRDDQDSLMRTSTDEGATWSSPATISGAGIIGRDGMLGVARLPDAGPGDLIAVFETGDTSSGGDGRFTINAVVSNDDGQTWGGRRRVYTAGQNGGNAGAPQVVLQHGTLVVSFMTDESTISGSWPETSRVKVVSSRDAWTWSDAVDVFGSQASWAGMVCIGTSEVLVLSDSRGVTTRRIQLGR